MASIGDALSSLVIAESGDVRRFHSYRALVAYAGINKFFRIYYGKVTGIYRSLEV